MDRPRGEPVLIVDDHPLNLKLLRLVLSAAGFQVATARDGEEALEMIRLHAPRLVLMDIQLPGMDGLEVTRHIKEHPATRHIKVIAVTAYAMKGDEAKATEAGCDGYVTKPIDSQQLIEAIMACLNQNS